MSSAPRGPLAGSPAPAVDPATSIESAPPRLVVDAPSAAPAVSAGVAIAQQADAQASDGSPPQPASVARSVLGRLWSALREVEDPEIPVSLVDMGLIIAMDYAPDERAARLKITYTAMGCPAMDMIQDDIRTRLLREPDVDRVDIDVVWDPVWTNRRLSQVAREAMRELGLSV